MDFIGRLRPLLNYFPIALVMAAALAEAVAMATADRHLGGLRVCGGDFLRS